MMGLLDQQRFPCWVKLADPDPERRGPGTSSVGCLLPVSMESVSSDLRLDCTVKCYKVRQRTVRPEGSLPSEPVAL